MRTQLGKNFEDRDKVNYGAWSVSLRQGAVSTVVTHVPVLGPCKRTQVKRLLSLATCFVHAEFWCEWFGYLYFYLVMGYDRAAAEKWL